MKRTDLTYHQVFEAFQKTVEAAPITARGDAGYDARLNALRELANAWEPYQKAVRSLVGHAQREAENNDVNGIAAAWGTNFSTSLIEDVRALSTKVYTLRQLVAASCRAKDDPRSDAVDELIRSLDPNSDEK